MCLGVKGTWGQFNSFWAEITGDTLFVQVGPCPGPGICTPMHMPIEPALSLYSDLFEHATTGYIKI